MENRIKLNKIIDNYIKRCYLVPDYIDLHRSDEKKAYTSYFNSLVCISEICTEYYIDDSVLNDVKNEFYTHQIYISTKINVGSLLLKDYDLIMNLIDDLLLNEWFETVGYLLLKDSYDLIMNLIDDLLLNEWFEAVVNIKKILEYEYFNRSL